MPAKSKAQQKLFGIAHAVQQGKIPASKVSAPAKDIAKNVKKGEVKKFAGTPTKNLPDRVKKEMKEAVAELVKEILNETPESKKYMLQQKLKAARERKAKLDAQPATPPKKTEGVVNEARTIGAIKIKKLKALATEMWKRNHDVSEDEIIDKLPSDWWDTWESADSEIRRLVSDTITDLTHNESIVKEGNNRSKISAQDAQKHSDPKKWNEFKTWLAKNRKTRATFWSDGGKTYAEINDGGSWKSFGLSGSYNVQDSVVPKSVNEDTTCPTCKGRGETKGTNCATCKGTGTMAAVTTNKNQFPLKKKTQLEMLEAKMGHPLSVPDKHALAIAYKTVKMPEAMVGVMGGMTKQQAMDTIERLTGKKYEERKTESVNEKIEDEYCPHCNKYCGKNANTCSYCGKPISRKTESATAQQPPKYATSQELEKMGIKSKFNGGDEIVTNDGKSWGFVGKDKWMCNEAVKPSNKYDNKFRCPKCHESDLKADSRGMHHCPKCGYKEKEADDDEFQMKDESKGFKVSGGVPVKEELNINSSLPWLAKLVQKKVYHVGAVTVMIALSETKGILGINALMAVNPTHQAQDAPRHIEAALDGITGLKDTVYKLDKIAPHKARRTNTSVQKLWLLPVDKVMQAEGVNEAHIPMETDRGSMYYRLRQQGMSDEEAREKVMKSEPWKYGKQKEKEGVNEADSDAGRKAKQLGLDYMKFGRYGKKGKVTHKIENGKLVPFSGAEPDKKGAAPKQTAKVALQGTAPKIDKYGKENDPSNWWRDAFHSRHGKVSKGEMAKMVRIHPDLTKAFKSLYGDYIEKDKDGNYVWPMMIELGI